MALTSAFRKTIRERAERDPAFRRDILQEAVKHMLAGDVDGGKRRIRAYINATVGFPGLAKIVRTPPKSLMRMFAPKGNPSARNLFGVLAALQEEEGVQFALGLTTVRRA